jgi:DNA-binding winged helix-turn-helix (wHTH) protein
LALFVLLLLNANEVVSTDRLVDELWSEQPPATAEKIVRNYVRYSGSNSATGFSTVYRGMSFGSSLANLTASGSRRLSTRRANSRPPSRRPRCGRRWGC